MSRPEIALLVSSYERPNHLRRCLASIAAQRGVDGKFEVVVTDDGSTDESPDIVRDFARLADFPVRLTTHRHDGFQLSRCRNEGAAASSAPYLLYLDGDCIVPPDHVALHLKHRRRGIVTAGDSYRLDRETSEGITEADIHAGDFMRWVSGRERRRLFRKSLSARFYTFVRHPVLPRLTGNNVGIWRDDFERVNGFDENFRGWGWEDRDLQFRLSRLGLRFASALRFTYACHLWHPVDPTFVGKQPESPNARYFRRRGRLTRCRNGLCKRDLHDVSARVLVAPEHRSRAQSLLQGRLRPSERPAEVEILFSPHGGTFSRRSDCKILVILRPDPQVHRLAREADIVVCDDELKGLREQLHFPLHQFEQALAAVA